MSGRISTRLPADEALLSLNSNVTSEAFIGLVVVVSPVVGSV